MTEIHIIFTTTTSVFSYLPLNHTKLYILLTPKYYRRDIEKENQKEGKANQGFLYLKQMHDESFESKAKKEEGPFSTLEINPLPPCVQHCNSQMEIKYYQKSSLFIT